MHRAHIAVTSLVMCTIFFIRSTHTITKLTLKQKILQEKRGKTKALMRATKEQFAKAKQLLDETQLTADSDARSLAKAKQLLDETQHAVDSDARSLAKALLIRNDSSAFDLQAAAQLVRAILTSSRGKGCGMDDEHCEHSLMILLRQLEARIELLPRVCDFDISELRGAPFVDGCQRVAPSREPGHNRNTDASCRAWLEHRKAAATNPFRTIDPHMLSWDSALGQLTHNTCRADRCAEFRQTRPQSPPNLCKSFAASMHGHHACFGIYDHVDSSLKDEMGMTWVPETCTIDNLSPDAACSVLQVQNIRRLLFVGDSFIR